MQQSTAATWMLETDFPTPFGALTTMFSTVTELELPHVVPLGCVASYDFHSHLLLVTLGPLALMSVCAASAAVLSRLGRARWSQICYSAALMISFVTLPSASITLFRTFHCRTLKESGDEFLLAVSRSVHVCRRAIS